jgi:hypothetical protein
MGTPFGSTLGSERTSPALTIALLLAGHREGSRASAQGGPGNVDRLGKNRDRVAAPEGTATLASSLRLASEAALPACNFNDVTRDRRIFLRLAVPPFSGRWRNARGNFTPPTPCLPRHPRLELRPTLGRASPCHGAWRGGRVVECTALEMRHRCKPIGGSNPSLSATIAHYLSESTYKSQTMAPSAPKLVPRRHDRQNSS